MDYVRLRIGDVAICKRIDLMRFRNILGKYFKVEDSVWILDVTKLDGDIREISRRIASLLNEDAEYVAQAVKQAIEDHRRKAEEELRRRLLSLLGACVFAVASATTEEEAKNADSIFTKRGDLYYLNKTKLAEAVLKKGIRTTDGIVRFIRNVMDLSNLRYFEEHLKWLESNAEDLLKGAVREYYSRTTIVLRDTGEDVEIIFGRRLSAEEMAVLREAFTTTYYVQDSMGNLTEHRLRVIKYDRRRGTFRIPYFAVPHLFKVAKRLGFRRVIDNVNWVKREILPPPKVDIRLYKFQAQALNAWLDANCRGVVVVPTGGGKTYIGMTALGYLSVPTLICVTTIELARQWIQKIKEHLGIEDVGLLGGGKHDIKDITVAIYNSAVKYIDRLIDRFDFIIFDECLTYDTLILTDRGWLPIGVIVEKGLPVKVLTHKGRFMPVIGWHKIPLKKRLVRVVLEDGTEIKCTEDHKFLTNRGWVEAVKLLSGDILYKVACSEKGQSDEINGVGGVIHNTVDEIQDFVYDITVAEDHSYVANGVIVHNCHHVPADSFRNVAFRLKARRRLGLSATPYRYDRNEALIFFSVGSVVYKAKYADMVRLRLASPLKYYRLYVRLNPEEYEQYLRASKISNSNPSKVQKLMKVAFNAREKYEVLKKVVRKLPEDKILVFCQYVDQAKRAYRALLEVAKGQVALLTGTTRADLRKKYFEQFKEGKKRIIVTTTVLDEGIDVPDAETAIILSGSGTERQMIQRIGRILRYRPNKVAKAIEIITRNTIEERIAERRSKVLKDYGISV
ncbi:hypothetical protein DRP04_10620 [Archaeoglobales archaeon]|nr:MAG: hypothetical protein DRP04_10620 [Archaeoglobales archaeon]